MVKKKLELIKFMAFEYKVCEEYLEGMALKGWELYESYAEHMVFHKIEPRKITYCVTDIDPTLTFKKKNKTQEDILFHGDLFRGSEEWKYVCNIKDMTIYQTDGEGEKIEPEVYEKDKFNDVLRSSLKQILSKLVILALFGYVLLMEFIAGKDVTYLFCDEYLVAGSLMLLCLLMIVFDSIRLIGWALKGIKSLKSDARVYYPTFDEAKLVRRVKYGLLIIGGFLIWCLALKSQSRMAWNSIVVMSLLVSSINMCGSAIICYIKSIRIREAMFVALTVAIFVFLFSFDFTGGSFEDTRRQNEYDPKKLVSLSDFSDESLNYEQRIVRYGLLGDYYNYEASADYDSIEYTLVESEYEWVLNKYIDKNIGKLEPYVNYNANLEGVLPSDVRIYQVGHYTVMVTKDKVLKFIAPTFYWTDGEVIIGKLYEKLLK